MNERRMSTIGWLLFVAGYVGLAWAFVYLSESTYMLSTYGVEKTAHILALDHVSSLPRSGITYYYEIEINGVTQQRGFRVRLPVDKNVPVLDVPGHPDFLDVGTRKSSLFELWSIQLGGPLSGILVLVMFVVMAVTAPKNFRMLWRQRPTFLIGSHKS